MVKSKEIPEDHGSYRMQARPEQGILFLLFTDNRNNLVSNYWFNDQMNKVVNELSKCGMFWNHAEW